MGDTEKKPSFEEGVAAVRVLLAAIGEDPDREGLIDTPARVMRALCEMRSGACMDPAKILGVTFDGGEADEIVALTGIPFTSLCEHHLLPFTGEADVAYLPREEGSGGYRVVGLSKLARIVDVYALRLQLQERIGVQVADALEKYLRPQGVAVRLRAHHSCMSCRGVRKSGAVMHTQVLRGVFSTNADTRAEVLRMFGSRRANE